MTIENFIKIQLAVAIAKLEAIKKSNRSEKGTHVILLEAEIITLQELLYQFK